MKGVRILGSRLLKAREVTRVKAREAATDQRLSRVMGVTSDRGEDDDGLQTIIPYFYGGDAHILLIELWVEKAGAVAEVTLRYKDMVRLRNTSARASVALVSAPRPSTPAARSVTENARGFDFAEALGRAGQRLTAEGRAFALMELERARPLAEGEDALILEGFLGLVRQPRGQRAEVAEALDVARLRRIGEARREGPAPHSTAARAAP